MYCTLILTAYILSGFPVPVPIVEILINWYRSDKILTNHNLPSAVIKGFHLDALCLPLTQLPNPSQRKLHRIPQVKSKPELADCTTEEQSFGRHVVCHLTNKCILLFTYPEKTVDVSRGHLSPRKLTSE